MDKFYFNPNLINIIIDYLTPLPKLPFIDELHYSTSEIRIDLYCWRYYPNYIIKYDLYNDFRDDFLRTGMRIDSSEFHVRRLRLLFPYLFINRWIIRF